MPAILFWNVNRQRLERLIAEASNRHRVDILILAEADIPVATLLHTLNVSEQHKFRYLTSPSPQFMVLTRFDTSLLHPLSGGGGVNIYHFIPPIGASLIIVAVHLSSKLYQTEHDQALTCTRVARRIETAETQVGHQRTVVVGDLNMDPFEYGVVGADGLHAIMDQRLAAKGGRTVQGEHRSYFYNPMWSRLGDSSTGPPGTYYYSSGKQVSFFWHTFDQVLVRPELLPRFSSDDLQVLTQVNSTRLIRADGRPDTANASDHLPILFRMRS